MRAYPIFANPRMVAGDDIRGDHFKCALQSVGQALKAGHYQPIEMARYRSRLEAIFPQGVCGLSATGSGPAGRSARPVGAAGGTYAAGRTTDRSGVGHGNRRCTDSDADVVRVKVSGSEAP